MKRDLRKHLGTLLPLFLVSSLLSGCGQAREKYGSQTSKPKKLNLGCGPDIREGYDNIDLYADDPRVIRMDVRKLSYADNTVDEVLCSHVLEHMAFQDVPIVLNETYRVLKKGGRVIIDVPDLEAVMKTWLELPEEQRWGPALVGIYGSQDGEGNFHKTGFTKARLAQVLREARFESVEVKQITSHGGPSLLGEGTK